ncbi:unnamed protein product [Cladocopium goreaui]|uniref:Dephospho-CoA kinase n=1 Tax=Cladocopium goreaui TaxID=2562237 RepID=A0A9P1CA97_9DINO|nr:unnamed protein product [Cladocopium goreaui]
MASISSDRVRRSRSLGDTLVVGLTGSIGMGKSTVSKWLQEMQVPLDDADATVHRLYAPGGEAVLPLKEAFGDEILSQEGGVDRGALSKLVVGEANAERLKHLEAIVHPLVEASRDHFISKARRQGEEKHCDVVMVVSAPAEQQRTRVLARNDMTPEKFTAILSKQVPDADKRRKADHIVDTGLTMEETKAQVMAFVKECREKVAAERDRDQRLQWLFLAAALAAGAAVAFGLQRMK